MANSNETYSLNIPKTSKPRVVVIGGGFGGVNFLKHIDTEKFQVVLLDRYNYHTFQPLLYQVATAGLEPDSVAGPFRKIIKKNNKSVFFRMLKVEAVDLDQNLVKTPHGQLEFDYLVVATGAKMNYFGNRSIAKHGFPLKQITHALDLRSHIFQQFEKLEVLSLDNKSKQSYLNFVVVGAGPTGVEVCGALSELKAHVLPNDYPDLDIDRVKIFLVEGLDQVLPAMSEKSGKRAEKYLKKMGVDILLNTMIDSYNGNQAKLNNGDAIDTETLIWAAGVRGNLIKGFAEKYIEKGRLAVNQYNQVLEDQRPLGNIFALGDAAYMKTKNYPKGIPGLAQPAIQQGRHLAKNIKRKVKGKPMLPFNYKNKGVMATIGRSKAVADLPNMKVSGFAGWVLWMAVHLLFLIGFRNKAIVLANWVWNFFTFDKGIRLILRPSSKGNDAITREMINEMDETQS